MKGGAFNPYLPSWEYIPDWSNLMYLTEEFMYMVLMIFIMATFSVWEIMYAGQHQLMIFRIGDMKELFIHVMRIH